MNIIIMYVYYIADYELSVAMCLEIYCRGLCIRYPRIHP